MHYDRPLAQSIVQECSGIVRLVSLAGRSPMAATRPATLQEVADLSGVSRGTASRALTGVGRVSAETRARVIAAAASLSYSTNSGARNLRRARAGSIGLWLPRGLRFMDYYMNFAFGVAESTQDRELTVSLISGDFPPAKANSIHVDGFVMADVDGGDELARAILSSGRPVVTSELVPPGMPQPTATVAADHQTATRMLLGGLRAGGAGSIAVLTPTVDQMWVVGVNDAAGAWSAETGVPLRLVPLDGIPTAPQIQRIIGDLITTTPDIDAIVCIPEGLGVGILSALRELGRSVPEDIQVVSFVDNATLPIVQPPISALDLRPREAGLRAGELLISLIEGEHEATSAPTRIEWFDVVYRERESTRRAQRTAP
ncbi:LacI family transcriptional regulator [Microbacterium sp. 4R-513]|uniref:LacI family DNA-binding transcriptional regulator n=1 Tax=Microbacterium sp. 4R-513 TaxID=2567934 RepID=UPI0013E1E0FD|nr:LacI family DNA-binding transcriptional regulator [Microbacterium sp. 4R-513]QIG38738.1 LacI family transcriptional regulator [Microbacterium sp. 4R-513]